MIISSSIFLAVRCQACSKLETHELSIFRLQKGKYRKMKCVCSNHEFQIKIDHLNNIYFKIPCSCPEGEHVFQYKLKDILRVKLHFGVCEETREVIFCVGNRNHIEEKVEGINREIDRIMESFGYESYFHNPEIMMESLNRVHALAEEHNLYCDCGSREIDMNLFPDRIELRCLKCNSLSVIYTETQEDLRNIKNTQAIIMHESAFACIDAINIMGEITQ